MSMQNVSTTSVELGRSMNDTKLKGQINNLLWRTRYDDQDEDDVLLEMRGKELYDLIVQEKKALLSKIKEYLLTMKQPLISQASYSTVDGRCAYCGDISGEQYNQAIDDIGEKLADILIKQEKAPSITDEKI